MGSGGIVIRQCARTDLAGVSEVCCRTGFGGDDIAQSGVFDDRTLFAMLFSRYYVLHEAESSFVAVPEDEPGRVAGYVLGCPDTARFERDFAFRYIPRIALRSFCVTLWRYPRTFRELLRWQRGNPFRSTNPAGEDYPAHLHIDLLPEFRRRGLGSLLLDRLESQFRDRGVPGIHLVTSNYHRSALPFYAKNGYHVVREEKQQMWSGISDYRSIVYVKRLIE